MGGTPEQGFALRRIGSHGIDAAAVNQVSPACTKNGQTRPLVLIPAYLPEPQLGSLVKQLASSAAIGGIVIVDDGSGLPSRGAFTAFTNSEHVYVLTHAVNLGKGAALKTGLNFVACAFPNSAGIVTADADGQHSPEDILRVAAALCEHPDSLVLGTRSFNRTAPYRSRFGNRMTRVIMRAVTGQNLQDTQTGLRGIPMDFVPELLRLRSTAYDFELDMLLACQKTAREMYEVPISTIYIDGNRSSHFDPLRDSMRIYFVFVRFAAASLLTAAIDNGVFILSMHFWPHIAACQAVSRLVAGWFQFTVGKRSVFRSNVRVAPALAKYWTLVVLSGTLSFVLIRFFLRYTSTGVVSAKLVAETMLFLVNFVAQRDVVFAPNRERRA